MDTMIRDLLDAGRVRAGQPLSLEVGECNPVAIAGEVIKDMSTIVGDRLLLSSEKEIHAWWGRELFHRALENLVGNAIKYGDARAPVTISIQQENKIVKVSVHNKGNPIPANEIRNLFKPYLRSKSAEDGPNKGLGLGLTLVAGVVKAHGGSIDVVSSVAEGTSFIMKLPIDCRAHNVGDASASKKHLKAQELSGKRKALVMKSRTDEKKHTAHSKAHRAGKTSAPSKTT
jgi:signal transduction histidine kinase